MKPEMKGTIIVIVVSIIMGFIIGSNHRNVLLYMIAPKNDRNVCSEQIVDFKKQYDIDSMLTVEREKYRAQLKTAAYTFNVPSGVKVDAPFTIYFILNPVDNPQILAKKLRKIISKDPVIKQLIETDTTKCSPKMRVILTGEDFEIIPVEGKEFNGLKSTNQFGDTRWAWHIQAKRTGESLPLYLNVWCDLPGALGGPIEMLPTCWVPEEYMPMRSYAYFQAYCFMKANWKPYLRQIGYEH